MDLKEKILKNLQANGFPEKRVSLPLEKLYEVADQNGVNLNEILKELESTGVTHEKSLDKIIFSSQLPNLKGDSFKKAQEMMGKMDPKDLAELQQKVASMSDEEREKLLEQAKAMGLF